MLDTFDKLYLLMGGILIVLLPGTQSFLHLICAYLCCMQSSSALEKLGHMRMPWVAGLYAAPRKPQPEV